MNMTQVPTTTKTGKEKVTKACAFLCKNFFSHIMLLAVVAAYCVGGAYLFQDIEMQDLLDSNAKNSEISKQMDGNRIGLAHRIWMYKWGPNYSQIIDELLLKYQTNFSDAAKNNKYGGDPQEPDDFSNGWKFSSALLYTISIVTTIGYGHICPASSTGMMVTMCYAIVGVPLMLSFLANIGDVMAKFFRLAYGRGCCYFCWKKRRQNYELNRQRLRDIREGRVAKNGSWKDTAIVDEKGKPKFASADDVKPVDDADQPPTSRRRHARSRSPSPNKAENDHNKDHDELENKKDDKDDKKTADKDKEVDDFDTFDIWEDIEDPDEEVINVPISLTLVIIAAYLFLGAVLFASWEGWSWITGAYFSFVTLSTIGFGDLVPGMDEVGTAKGNIKMGVCYFYVIFGLAVISMSFNLMMEEMLAKFRWLGKKLGIIEDKDEKHNKSEEKQPLVDNEDKTAMQKGDEDKRAIQQGDVKNRPITAISKTPMEFKENAGHETVDGAHVGGISDSHV